MLFARFDLMTEWRMRTAVFLMMRFFMIGPVIILLVATAAGCGPARPALLPAEGVVTLDGKPLAEASVIFQPTAGGRPATGVTDAEGRFKVGTFSQRDGALPGTHVVTIARSEGTSPSDTRWISPKVYSLADQSGLSATVATGSTTFTFALSSQGPAGKK
jgi:hypothetical protein